MFFYKKKVCVCVFLFSLFTSYGQRVSSQILESAILINKVSTNTIKKDVIGFPYLDEAFQPATIEPLNKTYFVRYNAVEDELEAKQRGQILILNKNVKKYIISLINTGEVIKILRNFENGKNGFFTVVKETKNASLYKKYRKIFVEGKKAQHASLNDSKSEYKQSKSNYFITSIGMGDNVKIIPKNKKKFIALFPDKKQEKVKDLIKKNKIKLNSEKDLIKFINLLNGII